MPAVIRNRPALLGTPKPIDWQGIGQALWDTNLMAPVRGAVGLLNADPYTLYTDTGAAGQQAAANSFDAAGGITVGSMPMPKPANSLSMGIKAYHGSPHSFDKFDMSKIGTGEGAQAYGHGLYFAEKESVARGYRDTLAKNKNIDGAMTAAWDRAAKLGDALKDPSLEIGSPEFKVAQAEYMKAVDEAKNMAPSNPGSMYEVNIDADPNAFLDWDKPLSEQPEAVRNAMDAAAAKHGVELRGAWGELDPGIAYDRLAKSNDAKNRSAATDALREAGIPGIKYLDAGSRGAGDGTRNYVVFDDKLISIVRKYGIAGASAMLGYNVMNGTTKAQATELGRADRQFKTKSGGGGR